MTTIRIYALALRYWALDGDEWKFAVEYARSLVEGFRR